MKPIASKIGVALVVLATTGCGGNSTDSSPKASPSATPSATAPAAAGHIVYGRFDPEGVTLFTANADGTGKKRLLSEGTYSEVPHWSIDGKRLAVLAFDGDRGVGAIVNADGTGFRAFNSPDGAPNLACTVWSPDSARLACEGFDIPGLDGIYTVRAADGKDLQRVTKHRDLPCAYSPDGTKLLFLRLNPADETHNEMMMMNVDGSGQKYVVDNVDVGCDWSPDGKTLLADSDGSLLIVSLDGKTTKIPIDGVASRGAFSPDGSSIIFSLHPGDHHTDIFTARLDGSHLVQITKSPEDEEFGDWGP